MDKITFIQTNDIHWKLTRPEGRTDIYYEAISAKLFEIFELARVHNAAGILVAGDIVDTPGIGNEAMGILGEILQESPCPIFTIGGQHDEWDHSPESLRRSPYGLFKRFRTIRSVSEEAVLLFAGAHDALSIIISGRDYSAAADVDENYYEPDRSNFPQSTGENPFIIHLAHGTVVNQKPIFDRYTLSSQLKTSADIVCVGDYHPGIGIQKTESGKTVVNPGALARVKATDSDMSRPIQVTIIEVREDRSFDIKFVPLQSAMPGEKVLSRERLEIEKQKKDDFNEFLDLLGSEDTFETQSDLELVEEIAVRDNIPNDVKSEVLRRIGVAEEELAKRQIQLAA